MIHNKLLLGVLALRSKSLAVASCVQSCTATVGTSDLACKAAFLTLFDIHNRRSQHRSLLAHLTLHARLLFDLFWHWQQKHVFYTNQHTQSPCVQGILYITVTLWSKEYIVTLLWRYTWSPTVQGLETLHTRSPCVHCWHIWPCMQGCFFDTFWHSQQKKPTPVTVGTSDLACKVAFWPFLTLTTEACILHQPAYTVTLCSRHTIHHSHLVIKGIHCHFALKVYMITYSSRLRNLKRMLISVQKS